MRLTAKERILLHLLESAQSVGEPEVSPELAQEGVARGASVELRHLAQFVRPLIREGLVRERVAHVTGIRQRRKVYELTHPGRVTATRLREKVGAQVVRIREGGAVREEALEQALQETATKTRFLDAVRQVQRTGVFDLARPRLVPEGVFVEQTWDAPHIETFVGRRRELEEVQREADGPRIFVIRGVPGIGKTAFAAKVCERVRGQRNLLWHRIRPWESGAAILANLGEFLEALDRPGLASVLKRGEAGVIAEVLRQDLPDTHALLVLDDAHEASREASSVFRMLAEGVASAPDVKVLILTRRALPFYDVRDVTIAGLVREIELAGLEPEEAAALLAGDEDPVPLPGLGRRLAGHPLFLNLVRSHRRDIPRALGDIERFIEETVYRDLSNPEKTAMKAASLYQVPIPRTALLSIPGVSYETLVTLQERSLLRLVGGERYEIHDTIRAFFEGVLTSKERRELERLATAQLREQAEQASRSRDYLGSAACLSNALRLANSPVDRRTLCESLGDANDRLGDLLGVTTAFREALGLAGDVETASRLHRKLAMAFVDRGQLTAAQREIEAGLDVLGGVESVERGWLDLVQARLAEKDEDGDRIMPPAERALETFERYRDTAGRAHALYEAGVGASWIGAVSQDGMPLAERYLQTALELAEAMGDPAFEAEIRVAMATVILFESGDYEAGMKHLRAVEESSGALSDLNLRALLHVRKAWFATRLKRDFPAAEVELREAERIARRIHNRRILADVKFEDGVTAAQHGHYGEAARLLEETGLDVTRSGFAAFAADAYFCAAAFSLAAGEWERFERVALVLRSPEFARVREVRFDRPAILAPLEALLCGDRKSFETGFADILRHAESLPAHSVYHHATLWQDHFYYCVALRALGREDEADAHRRRALELVRSYRNRQGGHFIESDYGDRISETIRIRMKVA